MAHSDKNIVITPHTGNTTNDPRITFSGANSNVSAQTVSLFVYPTSNGTLSIEGSAGQLFSITNNLSGSLFAVSDISGIPSVEVFSTGIVRLAEFNGNVLIGTAVSKNEALHVNGTISVNTANPIRFYDTDATHFVALKANTTVSTNVTWTLPATDGTLNQALVTNGSGNLSWAASGTTPVHLYPPANAYTETFDYVAGAVQTWTKPGAGNTYVIVELWGGGGSGGHGATDACGGGGGGGAYNTITVLLSDLQGNVTFIVPSGGASQTVATTPGNAGGNCNVRFALYKGGSNFDLFAYGGGAGGYSTAGGGGGGGGGIVSRGGSPGNATLGGNGGNPGGGIAARSSTSSAAPGAYAGGGGGGFGSSSATSAMAGGGAFWGGGGGGAGSDIATGEGSNPGGSSYYGGGGGGGGARAGTVGAGGTSTFGGNGSAGTTGGGASSDGTTPGGGSGGTEGGASGKGGDGRVKFTYW